MAIMLLGACASARPAAEPAAAPPAGGASAAGFAAPAAPVASVAPAAPAAPAALATLVVGRAGSGAAPQFWAGYVADKKGFFAQENLNVEQIAIPSAFTLTQALVSGDMQVVNFTVLSMAAAVAGGAPLKMVASAQLTPNIQLVVQPEVHSWDDLRGKTLGGGNSAGDYFDLTLQMMLAANGLQEGEYVARTMPSNARIPALQAGQVAGIITSDQEVVVAVAQGYHSLGYVHEYVKDLQYSGYLMDDGWAKAHADVTVRFLRALLRGAAWVYDPANREEASRIYADVASLDQPQAEGIYADVVGQQMLSRDLRPNVRGIENIVNIAYDKGALEQKPPVESWIDLSYLERASR